MRNSVTTLLLSLLFISCFAQNAKFELPARNKASAKKEKLNEAQYLTDISPLLWRDMKFPGKVNENESYYLSQRRANVFPQPDNYVYAQENYKQILDYVSVEISAICDGKTLTAQSTSDKLSPEQKNILAAVDLGTAISVKIKYKYKDQTKDKYGSRDRIIDGESAVTVIPDTEAEFPGGYKQLSEYFAGNVVNKAKEKDAGDKIYRAIVKFTITENGEVVEPKITRTSDSPKIDGLILEAVNKMPKWSPAQNSKGVKVKQEFSIPFGSGGC